MKIFSKTSLLIGAGVLLVGGSLALSSVTPVKGAGEIQPPRVRTSCSSPSPCTKFTNSGTGAGVKGVTDGNASTYQLGAVEGSAFGVTNGAYAFSAGRNGAIFENNNNSYYALYSQQDNSSGYSFGAQNSSTGGYFSVDDLGDGYFSGSVDATAYNTHLRTRGGDVRAFNAVSTRATIEDTGTARLMNGEGVVRFDGALARVIDMRQGYQVFLTPDGETRGLFVAQKYEAGFIVREIEHGRSNIMFDYRVVAHPVGSTNERLPSVTLKVPPHNDPGHVPQ